MSKGTSAPMETPDGVRPIQPVSTTEETLGALNNIKAGFIEIFNRDISNTAEFKLLKSHIIFRNQQNARWIGIDTQHHADNHNLTVKLERYEALLTKSNLVYYERLAVMLSQHKLDKNALDDAYLELNKFLEKLEKLGDKDE